jgi:hypothetical protein
MSCYGERITGEENCVKSKIEVGCQRFMFDEKIDNCFHVG